MVTRPSLRTIYEVIGAEKIDELVSAFYPKVYADANLIPIFTGDMEEIMQKQRMFLTQFTGGPSLFSEAYGSPRMRARHLSHEITPTRALSWLSCMKEAFEEVGLDQEPVGKEFFQRLQEVAAIMVNKEEASITE